MPYSINSIWFLNGLKYLFRNSSICCNYFAIRNSHNSTKMYHQLSKISGRLVSATNLQSPLFPIAPIALQRVEPPQIQYTFAHLSTVTEASACAAPGKRRLVPGTNIPYPPVPESIRKQQEQFQKEDDVPVFLKGGPLDGILYRLTMALCIAGIIGVAHTIYGHAVPKKQ